ncbi:MAG TPA: hypothetical protein VFZ85_03190 [Jiangellaceae bacterium]
MATKMVASPSTDRVAESERREGATRVTVAVLGTLVGLAGVEHGIGEILQGPATPDGLFIMSWPDAAAMEILSGEPAMTLIPNLFVTGVLAVAAGLMVIAWSIVAPRRYGGLGLMGLSMLLLLVGGGIAPPVMGLVVGAVATRIGTTPQGRVGRLGRALAPAWSWFLAGAALGYLGLVPGMPLAGLIGVASEWLVIGLAAFAFANLALALAAARAHDRLHAAGS